MDLKDKLIIALDVQTKSELQKLIDKLDGHATMVKVGMELYFSMGPEVILTLKSKNLKIFLDLKMHDIPNTVQHASKALTKLGVEVFNVHAAGGKKMMKAAMNGVKEALLENPKLKAPKVIAVTQLTSTSEDVLREELLINRPLEKTIVSYATMAKEAGLDGVVCSPLEVKLIKESLGKNFLCITPGVRPSGSDLGDQKRVMTPKEAIQSGSDYLVIGRPVTKAQDPVLAFNEIFKEIKNA